MLLTALFALSIGAIPATTTLSEVSIEYYIGLALLIAMGLCIDISKYLFWFYRKKHALFLFLSVTLVSFSWAASVAFFTTKQQDTLRVYQTESRQFAANTVTITALESAIAEKRQLLEKRLSSEYHRQWDKSDILLDEIDELTAKLKEHIVLSDHIGIEAAKAQLSTSALFTMLSSLFSLPLASVTHMAYGLLSLIIEVCALGVMSLAQTVRAPSDKKNVDTKMPKHTVEHVDYDAYLNKVKKNKRIRNDILSGKVDPLISHIIKKYLISHKEAKAIMTSLEAEGKMTIERNRYYLSQ